MKLFRLAVGTPNLKVWIDTAEIGMYQKTVRFLQRLVVFQAVIKQTHVHMKEYTTLQAIDFDSIHTSDLDELQNFAASTCTDSNSGCSQI